MPSLLKVIKHTHTTTYITSKPCSPILFLLDYNNQSRTSLATIYCPKPRNGNLCINFPYLHALGLWDGFLSASVDIPTECSGSTYQVHLPVTIIRSEARACSVALLALLTAGSNEVRFTFLFIRINFFKNIRRRYQSSNRPKTVYLIDRIMSNIDRQTIPDTYRWLC